ncbi:hypothetical protein EDB85DRAFT_1566143 [Lactarius pseudohatsudake]|nr:hypothetical protein EDB85DRAFT_125734 [Lactarius pseudohatsudake]KAH9041058.1 hypothetical protein EDB85DRAFT_1566143 [Lactarius pseudohatsudake]
MKLRSGTTTAAMTKATMAVVSRAHAISAPVFTNARRKKRTPASSSSGVFPWGLTFCHQCRRKTAKTPRPKMRCTLIRRRRRAMPQPVLRFLHRNTRRYPQLTFDRKTSACRNYCNCSLCSQKRGETYVSERDGWWRSWIARQGGSHRAAPIPAKKSKSKDPGAAQMPATTKQHATTMTTTTADAQVFDGSRSAMAVFTVSGEPLGSAFFHGNKARIVSVSQPRAFPTAATTTHTTPTTITASPIVPEPAQKQRQRQRRQHVFIGKSRKTWVRLVSRPAGAGRESRSWRAGVSGFSSWWGT